MTDIGIWLLSVGFVFIEAVTFDLFFRVFYKVKVKWIKRIPLLFAVMFLCAQSEAYVGSFKIILEIIFLAVYLKIIRNIVWWQGIFISATEFVLMFITEISFMLLGQGLGFDMVEDHVAQTGVIMVSLMVSDLLFIYLKRKYPPDEKLSLPYGRDLLPFMATPLISLGCVIYMYNDWEEMGFRNIQGYAAAVLYVLNLAMLVVLKITINDKEALRQAAIKGNDTQKKLDYFHDMQAVFERQGKKLHDYKNQLLTIQDLIKNGDPEKALCFTESLTESISVEMSAVNTDHPIVNAVLNQKYRMARSRGIRLIFTVGDLSGIDLNEEEIVIIFGNLLDNAIHACEGNANHGEKAVISLKTVYEDSQFELYVKNPVIEKVEIADGEVGVKYS